jgi:hypothetical protein
VQDTFVTQEAYAQNLDKLKSIQRKVAMWEDAYLALEHRNKFITSNRNKNDSGRKSKNFHTQIDGYIIDLKKKYEGKIKVNAALFKNLKLTHTDLISVQQFVPHEQIVPMFPILTRDDHLGIDSLLKLM